MPYRSGTPRILDTAGAVSLVKERIAPRLPDHIRLGMELHYDYEVDEANAAEVADALAASDIHLALITPGAHRHFAYGGIASLDDGERKEAEEYGLRTLELAYGPLRKAWHPDPELAPSFVLWNGSFGYDLASTGIAQMYRNLKESVAGLCRREAEKGGELFMAIEPKPNEGHPAMLLPTVASAILFWKRLAEEYGVDLASKGINKEFGHSEMIGLDHVYDTVEEIDNGMLVHMHVNSQGYNDGIILGGPGKFDIDHGARINGMNVAVAGLARQRGVREVERARYAGAPLRQRGAGRGSRGAVHPELGGVQDGGGGDGCGAAPGIPVEAGDGQGRGPGARDGGKRLPALRPHVQGLADAESPLQVEVGGAR